MNRAALILLVIATGILAIGVVTSVLSFGEVADPGPATALSGALIPSGLGLGILGVLFKLGARRRAT